mmetsp:Transcript_16653/g.37704  ORF Transcript_16653/g.37704 Transcript_16653/m.37704 type:complete len:293 (+) Transcript_16653:391-1269(+)
MSTTTTPHRQWPSANVVTPGHLRYALRKLSSPLTRKQASPPGGLVATQRQYEPSHGGRRWHSPHKPSTLRPRRKPLPPAGLAPRLLPRKTTAPGGAPPQGHATAAAPLRRHPLRAKAPAGALPGNPPLAATPPEADRCAPWHAEGEAQPRPRLRNSENPACLGNARALSPSAARSRLPSQVRPKLPPSPRQRLPTPFPSPRVAAICGVRPPRAWRRPPRRGPQRSPQRMTTRAMLAPWHLPACLSSKSRRKSATSTKAELRQTQSSGGRGLLLKTPAHAQGRKASTVPRWIH